MAARGRNLVLRCYIEGSEQNWRGLCVDLDIAAQGESLHEVHTMLDGMIRTYLQSAVTYPPRDRDRFLNRKAPLLVRLKIGMSFFVASLFANRSGNDKMTLICHHACPA
jgi:hypothetical protein